MAKTYLRDFTSGATGSITENKDGTARLIIRISGGKKIHDKVHASKNAAMASWRRANA